MLFLLLSLVTLNHALIQYEVLQKLNNNDFDFYIDARKDAGTYDEGTRVLNSHHESTLHHFDSFDQLQTVDCLNSKIGVHGWEDGDESSKTAETLKQLGFRNVEDLGNVGFASHEHKELFEIGKKEETEKTLPKCAKKNEMKHFEGEKGEQEKDGKHRGRCAENKLIGLYQLIKKRINNPELVFEEFKSEREQQFGEKHLEEEQEHHGHHKEHERKMKRVFELSQDELQIIHYSLDSWISGGKTMDEVKHIVFAYVKEENEEKGHHSNNWSSSDEETEKDEHHHGGRGQGRGSHSKIHSDSKDSEDFEKGRGRGRGRGSHSDSHSKDSEDFEMGGRGHRAGRGHGRCGDSSDSEDCDKRGSYREASLDSEEEEKKKKRTQMFVIGVSALGCSAMLAAFWILFCNGKSEVISTGEIVQKEEVVEVKVEFDQKDDLVSDVTGEGTLQTGQETDTGSTTLCAITGSPLEFEGENANTVLAE